MKVVLIRGMSMDGNFEYLFGFFTFLLFVHGMEKHDVNLQFYAAGIELEREFYMFTRGTP